MIPEAEKTRVVIYARVSTEHEAQLYALEYQLEWYKQILSQQSDWNLVGQYIDEGLTGTSAKKRPQFLKMIEDARRHKFDLIITREVSRFARNTVDTLQYTRLLKEKGVEVYFINDNIRTFEGDGELRLTLMATLAQDESRKMSTRVKSGIQTAMEKGVYWGTGNILGYDRVGREMVINPEQAKTVRMIFDMYLSGKGYAEIARNLESLGRLTATGRSNWHSGTIKQTLDNTFYCGIITYHKEYVPDYLEQKKVNNFGKIPFLTVKGKHEPIVTEEEFNTVQKIRASRRIDGQAGQYDKHVFGGKHKPKTIFNVLLQCECGGSFRHIKWSKYKDKTVWGYQCSNYIKRKRDVSENEEKSNVCSAGFRPERMYRTIAKMIFTSFFSVEDNRRQFANLALNKTIQLNMDLPDTDKIRELEKELEACEEEYIHLVTLLQVSQITPGVFTINNAELQGRKMRIEKSLEDMKNRDVVQKKEIDPLELEGICEELKSISSRFNQIDVDDRTLYKYVERIIVHRDTVDWYLCCNNNPYLHYRHQYNEKRFNILSRMKLYSVDLKKPDVYQYYHPSPNEPDYRWKDITINIWV